MKANHRLVLPLSFIILMDTISVGMILPILGPMFFDGNCFFLSDISPHLRSILYGITLAAPWASMIFGVPLLSMLSDRIGRKVVFIITLIGCMISFIFSIIAVINNNILLFIFSRFILGFMQANEALAQAVIADHSTHLNKVENMSQITLAATIGFIIGPTFGGVVSDHHLASWFNYTTPFVFSAILTFINLLFILILFKNNSQRMQTNSLAEAIYDLIRLLKLNKTRLIMLLFFLIQVCSGVFEQSMVVFLIKLYNFNSLEISWFLVAISVIFSISIFLMRYLTRIIRKKTMILISLLLISTGAFTILTIHHLYAVFASMTLISIGLALSYNILLAGLSNLANQEQHGSVMGISIVLVAFAWILPSLLNGAIMGYSNYFPMLIILVISVGLLKAVPNLRLDII